MSTRQLLIKTFTFLTFIYSAPLQFDITQFGISKYFFISFARIPHTIFFLYKFLTTLDLFISLLNITNQVDLAMLGFDFDQCGDI